MARRLHAADIYVFVPIWIGYLRIALVICSFAIALDDYKTSSFCYTLSFVCDFFDGFSARQCNQCSCFGELLDNVTDRCSTAGLLMILATFYPQSIHLLMTALILDVASHWYHTYSCQCHYHKHIEASRHWFLRLYYGVYPLFAFCCIGTELLYIGLYILHFNPLATVPLVHLPLIQLVYCVGIPACVVKNVVNVTQLCSAAHAIAANDAKRANHKHQDSKTS